MNVLYAYVQDRIEKGVLAVKTPPKLCNRFFDQYHLLYLKRRLWRVIGSLVRCSGCDRVPDLQLGGCRFESQPGLLRTKVYSAFHPPG